MSAQQGTIVGRGATRIPSSLIVIVLAGVLAFSVAALIRASTTGSANVLDPSGLASSETSARERHDALGRLVAVDPLDPADFAGSGTAARERHKALGRLATVDPLTPSDFASGGTSARERHEALGRLDAAAG